MTAAQFAFRLADFQLTKSGGNFCASISGRMQLSRSRQSVNGHPRVTADAGHDPSGVWKYAVGPVINLAGLLTLYAG
jgi:hypothetical protein